jgi:hypothetical protein
MQLFKSTQYMSSKLLWLLLLASMSMTAGNAIASSTDSDGSQGSNKIEAAISSFDDEDDEESSFISDFELADAPDPNLKKYKDPQFLITEYKRGRMAFLFGSYRISYDILLPLAEHGYSKAQATIGWMYHTGKGKKKDLGMALSWYEKAAKQNHPVALNNIGVFYEQGLYVGKSLKQAAKWYKESAEWGYPYAQYNLGILYHEGRGVKKDPNEAQFWLQIAALQGVTQAIEVLKKISGKAHGGNKKLAKHGDSLKSLEGKNSNHQSKKPDKSGSFNPHGGNKYKNIAERIKTKRETTKLDSGFDDFLKLPKEPTPKEKPKPAAGAASSPKLTKDIGNLKSSENKKVGDQFKSGEQFNEWLSDAQVAQQRLAQQKKAQKKTNSHILEIFNDDWVNARNKNYYTIQLARSDKLEWLLKMARKQPMLKETAYYTSMEKGKKWYNLVYGNFKNKKEANAEIKNLPKTVKEWSPRVRKFSDVHSNMSLDAPKVLIKKK